MNISRMIFVAAAVACGVGSASAAELLLTGDSNAKKGGSTYALDIVSDGDVRGFDFVIPVPKGAKVDVSKCLSALPKGFQGVCKHNEGEIAGIAISMEPKTLPAGVHSIGVVTISGAARASKNLEVQFNAAGMEAQVLSSKVGVSLD